MLGKWLTILLFFWIGSFLGRYRGDKKLPVTLIQLASVSMFGYKESLLKELRRSENIFKFKKTERYWKASSSEKSTTNNRVWRHLNKHWEKLKLQIGSVYAKKNTNRQWSWSTRSRLVVKSNLLNVQKKNFKRLEKKLRQKCWRRLQRLLNRV